MAQIAHVAGSFFTAEPLALNRQVNKFVRNGHVAGELVDQPPQAIISPHAGFRYSGSLAGRAFANAARHKYRQVVILSPSHRHRF